MIMLLVIICTACVLFLSCCVSEFTVRDTLINVLIFLTMIGVWATMVYLILHTFR